MTLGALLLAALLPQDEKSDEYVRGYVTALLEKEYKIAGPKVRVREGIVRIDPHQMMGKNTDEIIAAIRRVPGAVEVRFTEEAEGAVPWLPGWRLFGPLVADPRWPHFGATLRNYYDDPVILHGAAVSFGEFFSLAGYDAGEGGRFEVGVQAGVFAVFDMDSSSHDLVNADYWATLPFAYAWRRGDFSAFLRLYHQSSHLGDEYLLRPDVDPEDRVNLSYEEVDLKVSYDYGDFKAYAGGGYIIHVEPENVDKGSVQAGLQFDRKRWFSPVAAVDLQRHEQTGRRTDISLRAGVALGRPGERRVMFLLEYYRGRNPDGQFFERRMETLGFGLHVYF